MKASGIITLTTDFGLQDQYVGSLRGVIHSINPKAVIADISHSIPSFNITHAAFVLGCTFDLFPRGTIHVGVIDPGVGSARKPILIQTKNYFFIGPDNGLFSLVLLKEKVVAVYHLSNPRYFNRVVSHTFHGRDIFSPVAAHLSRGARPFRLGKKIGRFFTLQGMQCSAEKNSLAGSVIAIDKFGNVITNITQDFFDKHVGGKTFSIKIGSKIFGTLHKTYANVDHGKSVAVFGSSGFLEFALNQGNFALSGKITVGEQVRVVHGTGR